MGGFLSGLGKIGGAILGAVGGGMGAIGAGKAQERQAENERISRDNATQASLFNTRQQAMLQQLLAQERAKLDRAQLGITAPSARTGQLVRGSLLSNVRPASISGLPSRIASRIPKLQGGLSPAALSAMARGGGDELQRQAMLALLTKSDIPSMTDFSKGLLQAPTLGTYKSPSKWETGLGLGSVIAGGLGNVINERNKMRRPPPNVYSGVPAGTTNG